MIPFYFPKRPRYSTYALIQTKQMAESKFELMLEKWRRRLCDWGLARPTKPTDLSPYLGGSAPLWDNPAPKW
jgi:hypothetical protein